MKFAKTACLGFLVLAACSSANESNTFGNKPGGSGGAGGDGNAAGGAGSPGSGTSGQGGAAGGLGLEGGLAGGGNGGGGSGTPCQYADSTDHDGDGYSFADGDCNDCDTNVNPGAFDVPDGAGKGVDEDCNGTPDDEPTGCDTGLPLDAPNAFMGAKSIGLCRQADPGATGKNKTWGVLTAAWVKPDKSPEQVPVSHGVLPNFGVNNPQEGTNMLGLSSGSARSPSQPGYADVGGYDKGYTSGTPAGYPKESPACPGVQTGEAHDGAGLLLTIRVPTNAKSFKFNENFFTYEFPDFICSQFNDFFVAMLEPKVPTLPDGNISFDQDGNPISVNNSLLQVCIPQSAGGKNFPCPLGVNGIAGTGFDAFGQAHAATGWLQTQAPVAPGSVITLLFTIWDSGDGVLDSSVLIDNFTWSVEAGTGTPTTTPVPTPK